MKLSGFYRNIYGKAGFILQMVKDTLIIHVYIFGYIERGLSLQRFQLSLALCASASTHAFSCWRIKKVFYLFGYMMNCFVIA